MGVTTTLINKPYNPRAQDASPLAYNRAALYSGKALDFDGVNDSVDINNFSLNGYTAFSICFHKTDDFNTGMIFSSADSISDGVNIYQVSPGYFRARLNGVNVVDTTLNVSTEKGFFVFTYDGTNAKWYYQAENIDSGTTSQTFAISNTTSTIARQSYAAAQYLNGQIAGFKIFNTALTAAQIADLYNFPEKIVPTGVDNTALKLWLPMMESAGTTAYDGSGNGNHGTISGATYVNGVGAPVAQTSVIDWNKGVNTFTYSEDFSNADWETISVTKVSTSETDYIGGTTAANITWLAGTPRYFFQAKATNVASTLSFYVKSNGGGNKFRLFGNGTIAMGSDMTATSEWVRYDFEFTGNASQGIGIAHATDNSAADLLVCFAQLETNASVGSYTPTIGTAQPTPVLLPAGLTTGRDITGVNLFENVRKQGALNLDGQSWAEVHDNASVDVSEFTLEGWIYTNSITSDNRILSKWFSGYPNRTYQFSATNDDLYLYISDGSNSNNTFVLNVLSLNNWYHCVATYDGANLKIYLDGVLKITTASTMTLKDSDQPVYIGAYVGSLDPSDNTTAQPRIYNRALTAEEVQRNYNAGKNIYS
mgnify:CR=1 FL=1